MQDKHLREEDLVVTDDLEPVRSLNVDLLVTFVLA
jgi:hypothetical protein